MSRPELLVLTGLTGTESVVTRLRELDPDAAVLHHDLGTAGSGVVRRRLRHRTEDATTELELVHDCVTCTLREDVLRTLLAPGAPRRVVLHLDRWLEPAQVCRSLLRGGPNGVALDAVADLRGVVACVDDGTWLEDATGDDMLGDRGIAEFADDERTVAQVAVGQAEFADLVVRTGHADAWGRVRTDAVLARLAPAAGRVRLADLDERVFRAGPARRGRPDDVHAPLLRGEPPLRPDCGVDLLLFDARRPFHPGRLHSAIDVLLDGVVRTRGRIWLATRPDAVLWLESAGGGLSVGHADEWLAGAGPRAWAEASAERRALASLGWHPRFGDRAQDLVVIAHDADTADIEQELRAALLTDDELAAGEAAWRELPDPFGHHHNDPCADAVRPQAGDTAGGTPGST